MLRNLLWQWHLAVSTCAGLKPPGVTQMQCVKLMLPALELCPAKMSLQLSPLLNCVDPLLSQLMVSPSHQSPLGTSCCPPIRLLHWHVRSC